MDFKEKRWFAEKDTVIEDITTEDSFYLSDNILCVIKQFHLKKSNDEHIVKRYFIPVISSAADTEDAEYSLEFQSEMLRQYSKTGNIAASNGGTVKFHTFIPMAEILPLKVEPPKMRFGSSNVLAIIHTNQQTMISKTYKDMRGYCGKPGKIWLMNPEALRYQALAASGYQNIPKVYGMAVYHARTGEQTPINLLLEAVNGSGQVGEVFAESLSRPDQTLEICCFASETAKSVAQMHAAFLHSNLPGFDAVPADSADILRWTETAQHNFNQAMSAIRERCRKYPDAAMLKTLIQLGFSLNLPNAGLMKAQVHGDLHGDQGVIENSVIKWLDFEGPPAKECVSEDDDSRENLLTDLAGMIQAFRYMAHIRLYEHLGLNHQNPEDHEKQRKASLMFAGLMPADATLKPLIQTLNLWLNQVTTAFIDGYFDEAENLAIQTAILNQWNRNTARCLTMNWVSARAAHELHYETYARNWGWEGIPASRILIFTDGNRDISVCGKNLAALKRFIKS